MPANQLNGAAVDLLETPEDLRPPRLLSFRIHLGIWTIGRRAGERGLGTGGLLTMSRLYATRAGTRFATPPTRVTLPV